MVDGVMFLKMENEVYEWGCGRKKEHEMEYIYIK